MNYDKRTKCGYRMLSYCKGFYAAICALLTIVVISIPQACFAVVNDVPQYAAHYKKQVAVAAGAVASNLFQVGLGVRKIVRAVCIIAGASLIVSSFVQYKKYKQNPIETRFSTVIFTFLIGVGLILLSFVPMQVD